MTIVYKIAVWLLVIYNLQLNTATAAASALAAPQEPKRIFARNALNGEFNCLIIVAVLQFKCLQQHQPIRKKKEHVF